MKEKNWNIQFVRPETLDYNVVQPKVQKSDHYFFFNNI